MKVHTKVTFGTADFPEDTTRLVAELAADEAINSAHDTRSFRQVMAQHDLIPERIACGH